MLGLGEQTRPIELPARRVSWCERIQVRGFTLFLHCGFDLDGVVREIFVTGRRDDTDMAQAIADMAITISHLLQYGTRLSELANDLATRSDLMREVLIHALRIEREECHNAVAAYIAAGLAVTA